MNTFNNPILVTKPLSPDKADILKYFSDVIDSGWFTNIGVQHELFEKEIARYLHVENVSLFNNGTIALITALKALELPVGSEVITPAFTFAATPHSIAWNGLRPVFADIDPITLTLSVDAIERAITSKTSAILAVHVYGFPCDVKRIQKIAEKYNLKVIYDGAHAFTTKINGKSICEWGDITMLSFHATKLFNSIEGGALVYTDKQLGERLFELRNFGIKRLTNSDDAKEGIKTKDLIDQVGINGKMNEFQAVWGRETLKKVKQEQNKRIIISNIYKNRLSKFDAIEIPEMPSNASNSLQYFPILIENNGSSSRDDLYEYLLNHNIYSRKYFYPLCSEFGCYNELKSSSPKNLKVSHSIANKVLCLPFYGDLVDNDCKDIVALCDIIAHYFYEKK